MGDAECKGICDGSYRLLVQRELVLKEGREGCLRMRLQFRLVFEVLARKHEETHQTSLLHEAKLLVLEDVLFVSRDRLRDSCTLVQRNLFYKLEATVT